MSLLLLFALAHADDRSDTALRMRERLSEFVVVGTEQAHSIPASERREPLSLIKWADATIALGWYLGALALEHELAERGVSPWAEADGDARIAELAAALAAVERIDRVAESAFPEPCESFQALNGFFIRDDVPEDFHTHFDGVDRVASDFLDGPYLKEMSQDQVHHLNLGLVLTAKFVDASHDGRPLDAWAGELGLRILDHVSADDWLIRNPACDDKLVDRGSGAGQVAAGFAAVADVLSDGEVVLTFGSAEEALWDSQSSPDFPGYFNSDNLHMSMVTAALGDGWGEGTLDHLVVLAEQDGWWAYPLLHVVVQERFDHPAVADVLAIAEVHVDELGDAEPEGPPADTDHPHGWTSWNRYIRPADRHYRGQAGSEGYRYFGGDWLVLHHLVTLVALGPEGTVEAPAAEACGCRSGSGGGLALLALLAVRRRRSV
jgi:hypothetical protein